MVSNNPSEVERMDRDLDSQAGPVHCHGNLLFRYLMRASRKRRSEKEEHYGGRLNNHFLQDSGA